MVEIVINILRKECYKSDKFWQEKTGDAIIGGGGGNNNNNNNNINNNNNHL
jgi:hypothetical protein